MASSSMQPDSQNRIRPHISDDRLSKTSRLRRSWLEIERLKAEGVTDVMLVEALAKTGVKFTSRSAFATTLARVRKEIRDGKFQPALVSESLSSMANAQPVTPRSIATTLSATTPKPPSLVQESVEPLENDLYQPRPSKKELREKRASRINLDHPSKNPLLFAALQEQNK